MKSKKLLFVCILGMGLALALAGQSGSEIKVFAVNLSPVAIDIQMGDSQMLFQATGLAPNSASKFSRFAKAGAFQIWYKFAGAKVQLSPRNSGGQPLLYNLAAGKTYVIRVLNEQTVDMLELPEPSKASPVQPDQQVAKIAFFNASGSTLASVQVASAPNANVLVSVKDLASKDLCNFGTVNYPGEYGCFAFLPNQSKDLVSGYLDGSGKPIMTKFVENSYWALVVSIDPKSGNPVAALFNLGK